MQSTNIAGILSNFKIEQLNEMQLASIEAIAGNKIVDGGTIMMPMASMMKRLRRLARMSGK